MLSKRFNCTASKFLKEHKTYAKIKILLRNDIAAYKSTCTFFKNASEPKAVNL